MVCGQVNQSVFVCRSVSQCLCVGQSISVCVQVSHLYVLCIDLSHGPFGHSFGLIRFGPYHSFVASFCTTFWVVIFFSFFSSPLPVFLLSLFVSFICLFLLPTFRIVFSVPSMCIVVLYNPCVQSFYTIYTYRLFGPSMRVCFFNHPFVPSRTFWVFYQCMQIERNGGVCLRVCMCVCLMIYNY